MTGYLEAVAADPAAVEQEAALFGGLSDSVRELIDAAIRTQVSPEIIATATAELRRVAASLRLEQIETSYGQQAIEGPQQTWASPVIGVRNPIAPPLHLHHEPDGLVWADFHLGAGYEGPPGLVHGGMSALVMDHVLGEAVSAAGHWGMTGTLSLRYRRPTPLGRLRAEARIDRIDGRKAFVDGAILHAGEVTVEATGIFVLPASYVGAQSSPPRATS
jgi:acyl-coenzyme A thioesterase PaaI-like protein